MKEKQKRVAKACARCFKRKIKCDGGRPFCGKCFKAKAPCIYQEQQEGFEPLSIENPPVIQNSDAFSAIEELHSQNWRKAVSSQPTNVSKKKLEISLELRNSLLTHYIKFTSSGRLPYIPPTAFMEHAEQSPLFFNTACAAASLIAPDVIMNGLNRLELSRLFYENACASIAYALEKQTIASVISLMMLFIYSRDANMGPSSMNYRSMMAGMCLDMRLNENPPEAKTQKEHEENCLKINAFWYVYISDYATAIITGLNPFISEVQIHVPLPITKEEFDLEFYKLNRKHKVVREIGILQSSSGYIPTPLDVSVSGRYILIIKIYSLIARYIKKRRIAPNESPALDYMELSLHTSLEEWFQKASILFVDETISSLTWFNYYMLCWYHSAVISLNTAKLPRMKYLDSFELLYSEEFTRVIQSAQSVSKILSLFLNNQEIAKYGIQRYISQAIFSSSIIHEILIKLHQDPMIVEKARCDFNLNVEAARLLADSCLPNKLIYEKLIVRQNNLPVAPQTTNLDSIFNFCFTNDQQSFNFAEADPFATLTFSDVF